MKKLLLLFILLSCTKALCQTRPIPFNWYLAIYSEHLHSHYGNRDIDRELSLADLNLDFLKKNKVVVTKQDCHYKFGKFDSMSQPIILCKTSYIQNEQLFTIDYCHNSNEIGYIQFASAKPTWVYCSHDSKYIWIIPEKSDSGIQKFRTDGTIVATYPYSFSENQITRIGDYSFEYDGDLISSYNDEIHTKPSHSFRNRIEWNNKIPVKIFHTPGYLGYRGDDSEREEMNITIERSNSEGVWTDLSVWVEDVTFQGGKQILYKLHREIISN